MARIEQIYTDEKNQPNPLHQRSIFLICQPIITPLVNAANTHLFVILQILLHAIAQKFNYQPKKYHLLQNTTLIAFVILVYYI